MLEVLLLIERSVLGFLLCMLCLRIVLQSTKTGFYSALGLAVLELTNWWVLRILAICPPLMKRLFLRADLASWLALLICSCAMSGVELWFNTGYGLTQPVAAIWWLVVTLTERIVEMFLNIAWMMILGVVILSWVAPTHPIRMSLDQVLSPLFGLIRRVLPRFGAVDLSPLVAMLLIQILQHLNGRLFSTLL